MKVVLFYRLMLGYLTIFILIATVSGYTIFRLNQLNTKTYDILNIDNRILEFEKRLTDALLSQVRYGKKFVITKDSTFYDQFHSARDEFSKFLSEALVIVDTPLKKDCLEKARMDFERYQHLVDEEIKNISPNRAHSRQWYESQKERVSDRILDRLVALKSYSQQDIQTKVQFLGDAGASARKFAMLMSSLAVILVFAASYFITRSITKPLTLLIAKTREISNGVLRGDLEISSPPEIAELAKAFNSMCRELKVVDTMKSDFFSSMSHELRTPLTSIREGTSLLLEGVAGAVTEKQKKLLTILGEESNRLIGLVNSVLDLSKMEAGMMTYSFEQGTLAPLIDKVLLEIGPLAEAKQIGLETAVDKLLPFVKMDREKILQVLRNMIGNAVKFTPNKGQVRVTVQSTERGLKVSVADKGPGIPPENLAIIFEKFQQASSTGSYRVKGTGLGLAIAKHVITSHGGEIWAESEPGKGSTFSFVLPV